MNTVSKLFTEPSIVRLEEVLNELILAFNQKRHSVLSQYGVNETDVEIIRYLTDQEQKKMKEVGEHFHIKLSTLTSTVDKLEKAKLVKRKSSKDDRRVIYIQVTNRGQALIHDLSDPGHAVAEACMNDLSVPECDALTRGLEHMLAHIRTAE